MMSCHHVWQAFSCRHHGQQKSLFIPPANVSRLSGAGRHWTRVVECRRQEIRPHTRNKALGGLCCISSSIATAADLRHQPWRIVAPRPGIGAQCSLEQPARAEMFLSPNWSPSIRSRNVGKGLGRDIPVDLILLASLRRQGVQRGAATAAAFKTSESGSGSEECVEVASQNGVLQGGENPVDPILTRGGGAAIKANKFGGQAEAESLRTHKAGYKRSAIGNMGRRAVMLIGGATLWASLGCCRCCEEAVAAQDWSYGGPCGSVTWEGVCTSGPNQSPIDITSSKTEDGGSLGVLDFVYAPSTPSIKNTGHGTIQVSFGNASNILKVKGQTLQLLQFHFHAPSEHAFNGERYAMEAHLVHRDPVTRKLAVVGVMLDASKYAVPNKCLAASLAYVPQEHGWSVEAPIQLSPSFLLPPHHGKNGSRGYVHYGGSLTTPPCSEGVKWFVLDTPLQISSSQVLDFMRFSGDGHSLAFNSRPLQPLGDRTVFRGP